MTEYKQYFAISNDTTFIQSRFDFNSITFFYPYAYAKDSSKPTMTAKYEGDAIPWKVSLSTSDVHSLKQGYKCGGGNAFTLKSSLYVVGLAVKKTLLSTSFVLAPQNYPIRTLYLLNMTF